MKNFILLLLIGLDVCAYGQINDTSIQKLEIERLNTNLYDNIITALSGKLAGVQIKNTNNIWGSSDIIIRGHSSIMNSNQALFVIDGIPMDNSSLNCSSQINGEHGYDFGNVISDINISNIESVNILKGGAACALYGSKGTNGVIIITTKRGGNVNKDSKKFGIQYSSNFSIGMIDKSTFPKYQREYGAGYFMDEYSNSKYPGLVHDQDIDNDGENDYTVPYYEDASRGEKFAPDLYVYQFDAAEPSSSNYMRKSPWIAAENGPETFFTNAKNYTNEISLNFSNGPIDLRLSYENINKTGSMPNSYYKRNSLSLNGIYQILKNLNLSTSIIYNENKVKGRNATGSNSNILSSFRQWFQVNADLKTLENLYNITGNNVSWNRTSFEDETPAYWDNPYWVRYENFETDQRSQLLGTVQINYSILKYLKISGQYSIDTYNDIQEERKAIGSVAGEFGVVNNKVKSGYSKYTRDLRNTQLNLFLNFDRKFNNQIYLSTNLGVENYINYYKNYFASTNGGLVETNIYSLSNSKNTTLETEESESTNQINSYLGFITLGYNDLLFFDGTYRLERRLMNLYNISSSGGVIGVSYYSLASNFLFSKLLDYKFIDTGKLNLNYAILGNTNVSASDNLVPERTKSLEFGVDMILFNEHLGFNATFYKYNTDNQLIDLSLNPATGYSSRWVNIGEIENKGVEVALHGTPIQTKDFSWNIDLNWASNKNKIISLSDDKKNIQLASLQGGISINATVGQPYGTILGSDFVYHENGGKIINSSTGRYKVSSTTNQVIGNANPDWNANINNSFRYKNLTCSFLIDIQRGGDVFSLDLWYGMGTGLYEETAGLNDLGNPKRDPIVSNGDGTYASNSGGTINGGVLEDGSTNTVRVSNRDYRAMGWAVDPNARWTYDASYIKLREVTLTYDLPKELVKKLSLTGASVGISGSNLLILHKNLPYADPEASQSSGNIQGWQSGVMPAVRQFGIKLDIFI